MSGKREASYSIDPHTLQQKQKDQQINKQTQKNNDRKVTQQRIIFKIKKPEDSSHGQKKQSNVTFKLNESQQIKSADDDNKIGEKKSNDQKQKPTNPFTSLFVGNASTNNIFNGVGIFSNIKSTNLFTSNQETQDTSTATANQNKGGNQGVTITNGGSIFSSLNKTTSIFNNSGKGPSIFQNSIKNTPSSLFPQSQINNDDDGSGDSAELQEAQQVEANPQKSSAKFQYGENCPVIFTLRVSKFKKSGGQLVENVQIVLQKQKQTNIKYITVRLPATKKSIFSGILIEGKSEIKHLHGKKQNVEVAVFYKEKDAFTKTLLKFQFQNKDDGQKLFERLEELIQAKKSQSQNGGDKKQ